ncbi:ZNF121 isoform 3, partial [Pan troglodytes]
MAEIHNGGELCDFMENGEIFSEHSCLNAHMGTENTGDTYDCDEYGENFPMLHNSAPTGETLSVLNQCRKAFSLPPNVHQRTWIGDKSFEYSDCEEAFVDQSHLQANRITHNGETLYEQKQCGRAFTYSTSHAVSVKMHTVEKPYECKECGK